MSSAKHPSSQACAAFAEAWRSVREGAYSAFRRAVSPSLHRGECGVRRPAWRPSDIEHSAVAIAAMPRMKLRPGVP